MRKKFPLTSCYAFVIFNLRCFIKTHRPAGYNPLHYHVVTTLYTIMWLQPFTLSCGYNPLHYHVVTILYTIMWLQPSTLSCGYNPLHYHVVTTLYTIMWWVRTWHWSHILGQLKISKAQRLHLKMGITEVPTL